MEGSGVWEPLSPQGWVRFCHAFIPGELPRFMSMALRMCSFLWLLRQTPPTHGLNSGHHLPCLEAGSRRAGLPPCPHLLSLQGRLSHWVRAPHGLIPSSRTKTHFQMQSHPEVLRVWAPTYDFGGTRFNSISKRACFTSPCQKQERTFLGSFLCEAGGAPGGATQEIMEFPRTAAPKGPHSHMCWPSASGNLLNYL